jgi:predicted O-methyltransferase YrrM
MVRRKVRIEIRAESINEAGKTPRLKNLPFWQSFFTHLMDERLAEAKLLLRAIYPQDCPEYQQGIAEAEKLADVITEQREKVTTSYLSALEEKHSAFPDNPEPHLRLLHSALEARAVSCLFGKTDARLQAGDFSGALKMLDNVALAEQEYKGIDALRTACLKGLEGTREASPMSLEEPGMRPGSELCRQVRRGRDTTNPISGPDVHEASLSEGPKFSFVTIVLNGMPFIEYSLKSIYEFAHEIIIVEGAIEQCMFAANPDGSSTDGTVEFLRSFPDRQNKIKLIRGQWPEKCEMQNEALRHVTGDYVWLVDSDEIYKKQDLQRVKALVQSDPSITQLNFNGDNFWKGLDYIFVSPKFFENAAHWRRVFKFVRGARFTTHRPPTMVWPGSELTTEQMHLLDGHKTRQMGIIPYHYSYVLDKQVRQKIELYDRYGWGKDWNIDLHEWYNECFLKWTPESREQIEARYPVWTGDAASHTLPFEGTHPDVIIEYVLKKSFVHGGSAAPSFVMRHVIEAIHEISGRSEYESILAIETGTIRSYDENHLSTYHISRELGDRGSLISVDLSGDSIRKSRNICHGATNVEFVESDSIQYLRNLRDKKFHFAFLDSVNDKDIIFEEFRLLAPMMAESGILMVDDAGITPDGRTFDISVPAQKGHRVWQFLADCGIDPAILSTPDGHGTQLKVVFTKDNLARITERLSSPDSQPGGELSEMSAGKTKRVRVAADYVQSGTHVETQSSFGAEIRELFAKIRPRKIIETGTYLGTGTTTIIARALEALGIYDAAFYTIEVNPQHYARAKEHLAANNFKVHALNGLSVPRSVLPDRDQIARRTITDVDYDGIFADHSEEDRVALYYEETDFPGVGDDLLYTCLKQFDFKPDFVLLDSAGHMGSIEFDYLIENLQGECTIALDDIYHVKHHRSFQKIQEDQRFQLIVHSKEKFGFCIARFTPEPVQKKLEGDYTVADSASVKRILIARTDSIGDSVLAASMLPHIAEKFRDAKITVLCQEHVAELYESSPFVDRIITIPLEHRWETTAQYNAVIQQIKELRADLLLNSTYSDHEISDMPGLEFIPRRFAFRNTKRASYTHIIPMSHLCSRLSGQRQKMNGLLMNCSPSTTYKGERR